jgi:hypothetical protein
MTLDPDYRTNTLLPFAEYSKYKLGELKLLLSHAITNFPLLGDDSHRESVLNESEREQLADVSAAIDTTFTQTCDIAPEYTEEFNRLRYATAPEENSTIGVRAKLPIGRSMTESVCFGILCCWA